MKPRDSDKGLKRIPWRMSDKTYNEYVFYGAIASDNAPGTEEHEIAIDALKTLAGYPGPSCGDDGLLFEPVIIDKITTAGH